MHRDQTPVIHVQMHRDQTPSLFSCIRHRMREKASFTSREPFRYSLTYIFKKFTGVQLIYKFVIVSGGQQSESVIHISIFLKDSLPQSSLCYTIGPQLCISYIVYAYINPSLSLSLPSTACLYPSSIHSPLVCNKCSGIL